MIKKKSLSSVILLGIMCCTACGNSSNIVFLENNQDRLNTYDTDGKTIISQQYLSEMDKNYSILENWTFYGIEIKEVLRGNMEDKTIVVGEQQGYSTLKEKIEKYPEVLAERVLEEYKGYTDEELEDIYFYESNGSPLLSQGDTLILALASRNFEELDGEFWAITAEAYGKFYETADKSYKRIIDDSESATYSYEELQNVFR